MSRDDLCKTNPTILVAGGSLIASSRTLVLNRKEFDKGVSSFFEVINVWLQISGLFFACLKIKTVCPPLTKADKKDPKTLPPHPLS